MSARKIAQSLADKLITIRRDFHRHPELGFKEKRTTQKISQILISAGFKIVDHGLETGVVGLLETDSAGPVIALRGDIDGLPVEEQNSVEYKSRVPGVMHACGHDVHTTCVLGAAMILSQMKGEFTGSVKCIFEPAEELSGVGAIRMLEAGVMENPHVDMIFGLHCWPQIPRGKFGVKEGALMAAVDAIEIKVQGVGGHGALPHLTIDPIVAGSAIVVGLQTAVSRNLSPFETAVISICTFQAGTAFNVIPDKIVMTGTVRTFDPAVRDKIPPLIERITERTAQAMGASASLTYRRDQPAVINHPECTQIARRAVISVCGEQGPLGDLEPAMTGEDFGQLMEKTPGFLFWLGVRNDDKGIVNPLHSPIFDVDEAAIPLGAAVLAQSVLNACEQLKPA